MNLYGILQDAEKKAAEHFATNEGDFEVDGLLYCGNCKTKKQVHISVPFLGLDRIVPCVCKCESERLAREEEERKRKEFMNRVHDLRKAGFPDADMMNWTFANDDHANEDMSALARKYVENFETMRKDGKGLLLYGGVGTGKSFMAASIVNALIDKGYPCLMTNFARIINTVQGMYEGKQEYLDRLNDYALLAIDDLAAERNTEYMNEQVFNIIDARARAKLPLIVTTNLTGAELKNPSDMQKARIYSRLYEMCIVQKYDGPDRRRASYIKSNDKYKELLGL